MRRLRRIHTGRRLLRCSFCYSLLALLTINIGMARDGLAQELLTKPVSLKVVDQDVRSALGTLAKVARIKFSYVPELIATKGRVSLTAENEPLASVLDRLLTPLQLTYELAGKYIIITPQSEPTGASPTKNNEASLADLSISGKVLDDGGEGLPGVSVVVKGTARGTATDAKGEFTIAVPSGNSVLVFSFVGYTSKEIPVGNQRTIRVSLTPSENSLNEVVVVGYGQVNRKDLTGSVGKANVQDIQKAPVASFAEALGGRVAGVQVTSQDGQPGGGINIVIRGNNSVTQDNSPLYVIDGFPIDNPNNNTLNPADIESLEVLKDASATAIYGARAANGVIIITTKKGKEGPAVITYDGYYGTQQITKKIPVLSPYEFVKLQLELPGNATAATNTYLKGDRTLDYYKNVPGVDMQELVLGAAVPMQNHTLSINGGTPSTKYSISGNVFDQKGIQVNSGFKRYQGRLVLDQRVSPSFKVGVNLNYANTQAYGTVSQSNAQATRGTNTTAFLMYSIWGYRPVAGDSLVNLEDAFIDPENAAIGNTTFQVNPLIQAQNEVRESITNNLIFNGYAEKAFLPNLRLRISGGVTSNLAQNNSFFNSMTSQGNPRTSPNGQLVNGSVLYARSSSWLNENTLTYDLNVGNLHKVSLLVGNTLQQGTTATYGTRAIQLPNEVLGIRGLSQGIPSTITSTESLWTLASFLGRVNYNYKSKYLLTASFRADGSSRFSPANKWGYFPSGSVAWRFSDEPFMKRLKLIDDAKLRLGYGVTGNNRVSDFSYLSTIGNPIIASYSFNNQTPSIGSVPGSLGNAELRWERTAQTNLGLDLSLFKQRVSLTVDVYRKNTNDLLVNTNLPRVTGFLNLLKNVGSVRNEGLEISLGLNNLINRGGFRWNVDGNISFNRNQVLGLAPGQESIVSNVFMGTFFTNTPVAVTKLNNPIGQFYGYIWDGNYQVEDFDKLPHGTYLLKDNVPTNGNTRSAIQPGDIKYRDINGDGVVNNFDFTIIGSGIPKHIGGLTNNFQYKGFDLSVFFQWSYGNQVSNLNRIVFETGGSFPVNLNQYATVADRWTPDNPTNAIPRAGGSNAFSLFSSSRIIEDASFLRLKTVSLGYNVPAAWLQRIKLRSLRVYASGQNLITWTKYSGYDPEVSLNSLAYSSQVAVPGLDYSTYPRTRTLTIGLTTSF